MLVIAIEWQEGRETRRTETELTEWNPEQIRDLIKRAVKYSDAPIPNGLLNEGETL